MILNVYKEKNWTSFDVVAKVKGILGNKIKVGHAGTLDPLAEGVLIILTDEDTKKCREFVAMEKEYVAKIAFGITTPTYDMEMLPDKSKIQISLNEVSKLLKKMLPKYIGEINQKVPSYSAVKVSGKILYKEARKGRIVDSDLPVKRIKIYETSTLNSDVSEIETKEGKFEFPVFEFRIKCSSGTYIRSLAHDLGESLGCGGVLISLIRTRVGDLVIEKSKKVSELF